MVLSTLIVVTATAVVSAHHAYSSQYIYRHDGPAQKVIIHDKHGHHHVDYHAHPKYKFEYKVDDYHTGDYKHQQEWRDGHDTDSKYTYHVKHTRIVPKKHHTKEHHHEAVKNHHKEWEPKHHQEWREEHDNLHFFDYYAYPKYKFGYKVHDPHTGDNKQHHESRDGHDSKSQYSFHLKHIVPEKHNYW